MSSTPPLEQLKASLLDLNEPLGKRTRAIFYLRSIGTDEALNVLLKAVINKEDSELMRHELAYVIGQFQNANACCVLESIVSDLDDDAMVRHEAAEALGAIGDERALTVLKKFQTDKAPEVSETCELSIQLIEYKNSMNEKNEKDGLDRNPYLSIDPAPAASKSLSIEELRTIVLDTSLSLFQRYRAMFSLRNRNTKEAAEALSEAFVDSSALFRHEVAYVMGQMQNKYTIPALEKVMKDTNEHRMVRHEAAEALGSIGEPECEEILKTYRNDAQPVVRESCQVALDIMDYWGTTGN